MKWGNIITSDLLAYATYRHVLSATNFVFLHVYSDQDKGEVKKVVESKWPRHPSAHGKDLYNMCVWTASILKACIRCHHPDDEDYSIPDDAIHLQQHSRSVQRNQKMFINTKENLSNGAVSKESVTIESTTYEIAQAKSGTATASAGKEPQKMSTTCSAETSTEGGYKTQPELDTREASHPQRGRVRLAAHHMWRVPSLQGQMTQPQIVKLRKLEYHNTSRSSLWNLEASHPTRNTSYHLFITFPLHNTLFMYTSVSMCSKEWKLSLIPKSTTRECKDQYYKLVNISVYILWKVKYAKYELFAIDMLIGNTMTGSACR